MRNQLNISLKNSNLKRKIKKIATELDINMSTFVEYAILNYIIMFNRGEITKETFKKSPK